jgi:hypothetical protein
MQRGRGVFERRIGGRVERATQKGTRVAIAQPKGHHL